MLANAASYTFPPLHPYVISDNPCLSWSAIHMLQRVRTSSRATAIVIAMMFVADCANRQAEVIKYATAHAGRIVATTRPLWIKYNNIAVEIPESEYTPDIRALRPSRVVAGRGGVFLYVYSVYSKVTGIFVRYDPAFPTPATTPPDSVEMTYLRLGPDVYWFSMPR